MTTEAPWMRVFTRDWLARTGGLTPSDKGILSDLNAIMHERGGPVVFNEKLLAARCRATPKSFVKSVDTLIEAGLVSLEDGFLWSEDMQRQIEFQEKKSVNGKSAAKKRHEKIKQNQSSASADAMPYQIQMSDTEGQPPSGPDPSNTHSVDKLDAREAYRCASPSGLDGRTDASGDFEYWADQASVGAAEIDITDAPNIELFASDEDRDLASLVPDIEASFRDEPALDAPVIPFKIFRSGDDPAEYFSGIVDDVPCVVEDDAAAELVEYLTNDLDAADVGRVVPMLARLICVGELTRRGYFDLIGVPMTGARNA